MTGSEDAKCIAISLRSVPSSLRASDGREIPFGRALLTITNNCGKEASHIVVSVSLGQEGGTVQDVSGALGAQPAILPPGGSASWDVYDLLLPAHPGTSSKVHMFGYRAVLNWRFELTVSAEYLLKGSSGRMRTPELRWTVRWSVPDQESGAVILAIEEGKT